MTFGASTTADEVLRGRRLDGRIVVITGGSGGVGEESARALAGAGAHVAVVARDRDRATAAIRQIEKRRPGASLSWHHGDLTSLDSIRQVSEELLATYPRIDVLLGNAGVMGGPLRHTADGFESQFVTNYLAHYVLAARLVPALLAAGSARIVLVSSAAHCVAGIDWDDLHFDVRPYQGVVAYGQSKTALILLATELDRRFAAAGLRAAAVHPGVVRTDLGRSFTVEDRAAVQSLVPNPFSVMKSVEQGAATQVWASAVAAPTEIGGRYLEDCGVAEVNRLSSGRGGGVRPEAVDPVSGRRLVELSERMTGVALSAGADAYVAG